MSDPADELAGFRDALAQMAVRVGANVQPGQVVVVSSDVGKEETATAVAAAAYDAGARYVDVVVDDRRIARARAEHAGADSLAFAPPWIAERYRQLADARGAWIRLAGPAQPDTLDGIDPAVAMQVAPPVPPGLVDVVNASTTNWTVVPVPTRGWASIVHPDLDPDEALRALWREVAHACRLDEPDTVAAWERRVAELQDVAGWLTAARFDRIHLTGPGTDLTVGLLATSVWTTTGQETVDGVSHRANLPSEEVLTAPDPARVDGTVQTTKPLLIAGATVDGLRLTFAAGRVVEHRAQRGDEVVRETLDRDEGARRLGELALVDRSGRTGALDTTFHETLLDENAASHVALGSAFPFCVQSEEDRALINRSQAHVDLMVGSDAVRVDGVAADGSVTPLLRDGRWQRGPS